MYMTNGDPDRFASKQFVDQITELENNLIKYFETSGDENSN
eukprot:CAMPEP_0176371274 /NCGR_PEP_ID=MMETSP0126-20121128/24583_1 /TAXON_ID=141414 ORGANISM="Strombidinopsis acuminatum, Strain SPMC142" /NCGR_SAMPLE_ID=MMETSP0126 /ASSEMBLY_ACC=CAM_ASM_000229 /LENGTH=40 /DNA_ID= /DNA_START= /DNA_END= /DNA_ORIENTATION=